MGHRRDYLAKHIEDRLSEKSVKRENGCVEWTGATDGKGRYGSICYNGKDQRAHRVSYEVFVGPIPRGLYVLHRCDNTLCINPAHLFVGTQSQNMFDASAKGRSQEGHAKLSRDQVLKVLSDPRPGTVIAKELGVGHTTIHNIKSRKAWRHVSPQP